MSTIIVDGVEHPLSPRFMSEVGEPHPDLVGLTYDRLIAEREYLKRLANDRYEFMAPQPTGELAPGGTLTMAEWKRLRAIDAVVNVHRGVRFLQGRPLSDFGFEHADQIKGKRSAIACGCTLHMVVDHYRVGETGATEHPHYPQMRCEKHAGEGDFRAHFEAALRDNP